MTKFHQRYKANMYSVLNERAHFWAIPAYPVIPSGLRVYKGKFAMNKNPIETIFLLTKLVPSEVLVGGAHGTHRDFPSIKR